MLILYRKSGETIRIGDNITVTLLTHSQHYSTLRVTTPKCVTVHVAEYSQPCKPELVGSTAEYLLMRRINQCIIIHRQVVVTILGRQDGMVEFGIEAPRQLPVHREEKYQEFKRQSPDGKVGPGGRDFFPVRVSRRGSLPGGPMIYEKLKRMADRSAESVIPMDDIAAMDRQKDRRNADGDRSLWGGIDWDAEGDQFPVMGGGKDA